MATKTNKTAEEAVEKEASGLLEEARAMIAEMLSEAEKKAQEIINAAKSEAAKPVAAASGAVLPEKIVQSEEELKKLVKVKLRKDRNNPKPDLFVGVNGNTFVIKRGVEVEVPGYVARLIADSEAQEEYAIEYMEKLENQYIEETKAIENGE